MQGPPSAGRLMLALALLLGLVPVTYCTPAEGGRAAIAFAGSHAHAGHADAGHDCGCDADSCGHGEPQHGACCVDSPASFVAPIGPGAGVPDLLACPPPAPDAAHVSTGRDPIRRDGTHEAPRPPPEGVRGVVLLR